MLRLLPHPAILTSHSAVSETAPQFPASQFLSQSLFLGNPAEDAVLSLPLCGDLGGHLFQMVQLGDDRSSIC